jgi:hypothetical protein
MCEISFVTTPHERSHDTYIITSSPTSCLLFYTNLLRVFCLHLVVPWSRIVQSKVPLSLGGAAVNDIFLWYPYEDMGTRKWVQNWSEYVHAFDKSLRQKPNFLEFGPPKNKLKNMARFFTTGFTRLTTHKKDLKKKKKKLSYLVYSQISLKCFFFLGERIVSLATSQNWETQNPSFIIASTGKTLTLTPPYCVPPATMIFCSLIW